ncbi:MAG: DUF4956 domain-containing protein [Bacteroidales bacterium]|nr:DUF4956 domain-containing protein [Bacteroidales bacterium]
MVEMEDLELLDAPLIDTADMTALLLRFLFNTVFVMIIIAGLYYPKSRRREYFFTFALISVSIFFLIYLLGSVKIKVGFALGLFAIFGIIRYRTESMSVREMTYLFVIIALSVINALAVSLSFGELTLTNLIFIAIIFFCERLPFANSYEEKYVIYDRIDLITPEKRDELIADLRQRLGLEIANVQIGAVDFLRDTAMLKVYYRDKKRFGDNIVNKMLKLPKEE